MKEKVKKRKNSSAKNKKTQINKEVGIRRRHGIKYTLSLAREREEGKEYEAEEEKKIGRGRGKVEKGKKGTERKEQRITEH